MRRRAVSDSDQLPEDDFSLLDEGEIASEEKREGLRRVRDERKAAEEQRALDNGERVILLGLLVFAARVAVAVVLVGLSRENDELVHAGLVALAGACGAFLRVRFLSANS